MKVTGTIKYAEIVAILTLVLISLYLPTGWTTVIGTKSDIKFLEFYDPY